RSIGLFISLYPPPHISPAPLHYIRNREIVLLLLCIPYDADFLALKELYGEIIERTKEENRFLASVI
ncbi:MAG: hypothetical protein J6N43_03995, partial [Prevotella sp.]|nr:hypothetical protein [Prevotella sp.]